MKETMLANREIGFLLNEWLDIQALCRRPRFAALRREKFEAALVRAAQLSRDVLAPANRQLDEQELQLLGEKVWAPSLLGEVLKAVQNSALLSVAHDREYGGMQLPILLEKAVTACLFAGSASVMAYLHPIQAASRLLLGHASRAFAAYWVPLLLGGKATCTFCTSEPQAGSSLSDIRTRAVRQENGSFRLYGNKMWVVGGDHELADNIVHLVLAKIESEQGSIEPGAESLSLFLVPKYLPEGFAAGIDELWPMDGARPPAQGQASVLSAGGKDPGNHNDVAAVGIYPQMGQRGATSCLMSFGEGYHLPSGQAGAVAWLVGDENAGMALINEAAPDIQINIALSAAALGYVGYANALLYARERHQGRFPGVNSHLGGQVPIIEHADIRRMLLVQKSFVEGSLALGLWCARLMDEAETAETPMDRLRARELLCLLAPVAKSCSARNCLKANALAIQVLGCYGYTRDYLVEQIYRDNRINPILEGTSGILSLEMMRDRLLTDDFMGFQRFAYEVEQTLGRAAARCGDIRHMAIQLQKYAERFGWLINRLRQEPDIGRRLANASIFMEAFGYYVIAWIWLEQVLVAEVANLSAYGSERSFYAGKCQTARFFYQHELPKIDSQLTLLEQMDMCAMDMQPAWF